MKDFPKRKPTRLPEYNYCNEGIYFITVCVQNRVEMLGKIILLDENNINTAVMQLSEAGIIVKKYIERVPGLKNYVIMPNHLHMLISIDNGNECSISQRILSLKTLVSKELGYALFQRSFHDHIVRNEKEYFFIWDYIEHNIVNWADDCFYRKT